jgi:hypothetical protein
MSSLTGSSLRIDSGRPLRDVWKRALWVLLHGFAGCVLGLALGTSVAEAQGKTFAKQRKYVTAHALPPAAEIPVAPEGMPQADAAPAAPSEATAAPPAASSPAVGVAAPATVLAAPPVVAAPPAAGAYPAPVYAAPAPAPIYAAPPPVYAAPPPPNWAPPAAAAPSARYMLVPIPQQAAPAPDARQTWLTSQLAQVDQQLALLRRERKSIGGPIVQMTLGYLGTIVFVSVAAGSFFAAEELEEDDDWGDHSYDQHDEERLRNTGYAFTGLTVAALAVGIAGTVRLVRNAAVNRGVKAERRNLLAQRASLRQQLSYSASALPGRLQLGVHGRF